MDAALAELNKQSEDPDAILELCAVLKTTAHRNGWQLEQLTVTLNRVGQKAEAFKKKGNERLKDGLKMLHKMLDLG